MPRARDWTPPSITLFPPKGTEEARSPRTGLLSFLVLEDCSAIKTPLKPEPRRKTTLSKRFIEIPREGLITFRTAE